MQGYNCIMVYHQDRDKLLFCKRMCDPYKGKYNLVGGKIEPGENGFDAAYRELYEETGIGREQIVLHHMMDFTYYNQGCYMEVYAGTLRETVRLREEKHAVLAGHRRGGLFFTGQIRRRREYRAYAGAGQGLWHGKKRGAGK